ncbi:MAG TPA: filamentous hemagglutinin N-terminal domain-containing protein, partial [Ramlibacter sp.]|nr:filamentous hemagglutinin N-terminal domain-containing protein [Ramlibacter sp.]
MKSHPLAQTSRRGAAAFRTVTVQVSRKLKAVYRVRIGRLLSRLLAGLMAAFVSQVMAQLPQGLQSPGQGIQESARTSTSLVLTQGVDRAIANWQSFSIGAGHSVQFVQPGASSVALNRVLGQNASQIFGSLTANGQVFLVNPNGVLFAPGASVNVGGLVASTLNLSNEDFLAGRYTFSGPGGMVTNNGALKAGYVVLAGAQVANNGTIETPTGGSVGLLAGSRVSVDPNGDGLVKFSVDAGAVNAMASNTGVLKADGGQVSMLASAVGDTLQTVINQSGVIRANTVVNNNGTVTLSGGPRGVVTVSGTVQARGDDAGEKGGTVKVLGDRVGLMAGANVDAGGDAGGGTVLVGGNFQGKGPEQNATVTYVDRDARIGVDAGTAGQGGTVIVWADGTTRAHGTVSARGGAQGGDGGFVEISGKQHLSFSASVDTRAPAGKRGTLLLDPENINIVNTGTDDLEDDGAAPGTPATYAFTENAGLTSDVAAATLVGQNSDIVLQATKNITFNEAVTLNAGKSLTAEAGQDIVVNQAITTTGAGF